MELKKFKDYINNHWNKYKESISDISKNDRISLVVSNEELFNFDKIKDDIYINENIKPTSVDGLQITDKEVNLIEFKSGFKNKISKNTFDSEKAKCEVLDDICNDYWDLFDNKRNLEIKGLIHSLQMKAVESYLTLEKKIYPAINIKNEDIQPNLTVVIDSNATDSMESILGELAKKEPPKNNIIEKVNEALSRFKNKKDYNGECYYYKNISVISAAEYEKKVNRS